MSKKISLIFIFGIFLYNVVIGQGLSKENQRLVFRLIEDVKQNKRELISNLVDYPLKREYPIPSINNKQELLDRFDEIFDDELKKSIVTSIPAKDWEEVGWRGIMLKNGDLWINTEGRIIAINHQSAREKARLDKLIKYEKSQIHESLSQFIKPICIIETSRFRVRIDLVKEDCYRYASWSKKVSMTGKPDLIINNGKLKMDGSGGNCSYIFKNKEYTYECELIELGEETSPPAKLSIYKDDRVILSQDGNLIAIK